MRGRTDLRVLSPLVRALKRERPNIVQTHTGRTNLLARLAGLFVPFKKLATVHSPILLDTNIDLTPKKLNYWVERFTSRASHFFVCVSKEGRANLVKQGIPERKIAVIYNGVDFEAISARETSTYTRLRNEFEYSGAHVIIALIAQLRPRKGAEYFIKSVRHVHERVPGARFLIVGDAEFVEGKDYLEELRALARSERVDHLIHFTGFRKDADAIMGMVDILVLPSLFGEGLPLVVLEGMALALPVVATDTSGNREAIADGETGFLVPPADSLRLAEAMEKLAQEPELRTTMGKAGKQRAHEMFSLKRTLEQYAAIYRSLVEKT